MARLRVEQAEKNRQDTTLRAPFDGVVAARLVDNHVQVQARQPVLLVEAAEALEVVIDLPERVIASFAKRRVIARSARRYSQRCRSGASR
jgi:membrane fusion protein, multidrug efflux system